MIKTIKRVYCWNKLAKLCRCNSSKYYWLTHSLTDPIRRVGARRCYCNIKSKLWNGLGGAHRVHFEHWEETVFWQISPVWSLVRGSCNVCQQLSFINLFPQYFFVKCENIHFYWEGVESAIFYLNIPKSVSDSKVPVILLVPGRLVEYIFHIPDSREILQSNVLGPGMYAFATLSGLRKDILVWWVL